MPPSLSATRNLPILVADDDDVTRATLRDILEDAGYQTILEAPDGTHALDILRTGPQRFVVLLDWLMPHSAGADVLLARASDTPSFGRHAYVVLTADARVSQTDIDALHLPPDMWVALLRKPFALDDVLQTVESAANALLLPEATATAPTPDTSHM